MNIVFMGTPDFAAESLEAIISAGHNVTAVFTQPDKPVGRKHILTAPPVKECAQKHNIPVFQPESVRTADAVEQIKSQNPDVCVVVAYGKMLPDDILKVAKHGCINVHASLLPKYRGASPIQWSIVCGERKTGVATMLLDSGMDTGDVLQMRECEIKDTDTAETLWDRLSTLGAELICDTLKAVENGTVTRTPQDHSLATYAPIIKKEDGLIDFNKSAYVIDCLIRGLHNWPVAYTYADGKRLKIYSATPFERNCDAGEILQADGKLIIGCGENTALEITELQLEGSKRMNTADFLRGKTITSLKGVN